MLRIFSIVLFFLLPFVVVAQTNVTGLIKDKSSGEPLIGVNLIIEGTYVGTSTDKNGTFSLSTTLPTPFQLIISIVGFKSQTISIDDEATPLDIQMDEEVMVGQEVVISASRVEESILTSPVSIEKLDIIKIQQTTAANFYDGLHNMKGVDMNVQGLTFRVPNTRGFNGNTNYRFSQYVDGMENIPPGLSFAAGNILGLSQMDVESVELLVGASSAIYGPGGMNGTLLMTSKNPYEYQGLSASLQTGVMHVGADYRDSPAPMTDFNIRYAKAFNDRFAFKVTGSYLKATDWYAADYRNKNDLNNPNSTRRNDPGYDGVNVYGDDVIVPVNIQDAARGIAAGVADNIGLSTTDPTYPAFIDSVASIFPDQNITRTGWDEKDLADYNTQNFRAGASLNYRFKNKWEAILSGGYSNGTSVYTAQNRFSLVNFQAISGRFEIRNPNFFARVWGLKEDAGQTFDAGATGLLMNEGWKSSEDWYTDYFSAFAQSFLLGNPESVAYSVGRLFADNRTPDGAVLDSSKPFFPLPGEPEFERLRDEITSNPLGQGGTKTVDKTSMYNFQTMYNFNKIITAFELVAGFDYRLYNISSDGTIFFDTPGNPIYQNQYGGFIQISKGVLNDRLKFTLSGRYDKNEKFSGRATPRLSLVYAIDQFKSHNFRASIQTAFRFPSTSDQWVDLDVGRFKVIGGLPEVHEAYGFDTTNVYPLTGLNPITDEPFLDDGPFIIPAFRPEEVAAFELGYRGVYLSGRLFVDAYWYQNVYNGFLTTQLLVQFPNTPQEQRYQTFISTESEVSSSGWALGADYRFVNDFFLTGNVSYNTLKAVDLPVGVLTQFNTPDYRLNLGIGKREFIKNVSFNVNWRWQNEFLWESTFGVADIPAYNTLDVQVSYKVKSIKSIFKIGGSNVLNSYYTTGFGNAAVGGLYYVTWTFDDMLN